MSWEHENYKNQRIQKSQSQGLDKPYASRVSSVSPQNEKAIVKNFSTKGRTFPIPHPFVSIESWIRAMPQDGTKYLTFTRSDSAQPQMSGTFYDDSSVRLNSYQGGQGTYRPLFPGEIEINSGGLAQTHYARRPVMNSKAGVIERTMNQDHLKTYDRAPIHHRTFLLNKSGELGDEHKIGVVERYKNTWEKFYPKINDKFIAEEYLELKNPAKAGPIVMFRVQRGHVVDAAGSPIAQTVTGLPLRHQEIYYSNDDTDTREEIDELGNYLIQLSPAASQGYQLNVPSGNAKFRINLDWDATIEANRTNTISGSDALTVEGSRRVNITEDTTYQTANFILTADDQVSMDAQQLNVNMQSAIQYQSLGTMAFESTGAAQFSGLGGTNLGNPGSATLVLGSTVGLAGGGVPVGRFGDKIVGNTIPFGLPVVGMIAQGSPKVTSA